MSKFLANDPISLRIPVQGKWVYVPGIAVADSYQGQAFNRNTGAMEPTELVEAITHHVLANGHAYYKRAPQKAAFCDLRTVAAPAIDELLAEDLIAEVAKSLAEQDAANAAARSVENVVKPKANFSHVAVAAK